MKHCVNRSPDAGKSAADYASEITREWRRAVAAIFRVGKLLNDAKEALPHGEFGLMLQRIHFGQRRAQRLMSIAENIVLTNPTHESLLPACWTTLYELAKIPDPILRELLFNGTITPELEREDVKQILAQVDSEKMMLYQHVANALRVLKKVAHANQSPPRGLITDLMANEDGAFDLDTDMFVVMAWLLKVHRQAVALSKPNVEKTTNEPVSRL